MSELAEAKTPTPVEAPLTGREKFEAQFPHIVDIEYDENRLAAFRASIIDNTETEKAHNALAQADNNIEAVTNDRTEKPSKAVTAKTERRAVALKAERKAIEVRHEQQMASTPGSMRTAINEFLRSPAVYDRYIAANTSAEIEEGETLADAMKRTHAAWHERRAAKKAIIRAPLPAEEIEFNCADWVARNAVKMDQVLSGMVRPFFNEKYQTFSQRRVAPPKDEKGAVDALGVLNATLGALMSTGLAQLAMQGHDESKALGYVERDAMLRAVNAELERLEYQAEAIHRLARKRGDNAGPRLSGNILAILDLKRV
jgi:hypothetical protein